jgi:hypothetical protein
MTAQEFYNLKVKKAKNFGFPDPIFINTEKLTNKSRVIYLVEIQATHIFDKKRQKTHHFALKFSKFKKQEEEWIEEDIATESGFTIADRASINKLSAYIKANEALLNIDILSKDYTSAILTNDEVTIDLVRQILTSEKNKDAIFELFKEQYPKLDKKILTYKLVQARRVALEEFEKSLPDTNKIERNYWRTFLEKNRWMFGLSYFILLDDSRINTKNTTDYLLESEDGFVDIVEIKHPHIDFWQKNSNKEYRRYRDFLQQSEELKGAITQAVNYIFELEKNFSSPDWCRENKCETPVKPKCTIIFGRSNKWGLEEKTAFRLLNDSLHGIDIITFDHLYSRASRLLKSLEKET